MGKVGLMPDTAPPTDLCCDAHNLHKLPQMHKMHKSNAKNIKCKKVSYKSFGQNKDEGKNRGKKLQNASTVKLSCGTVYWLGGRQEGTGKESSYSLKIIKGPPSWEI